MTATSSNPARECQPGRAPARRIAALCLVLAIVTVLLVPEAFPVWAQVVSAADYRTIIIVLLVTSLELRHMTTPPEAI